MARISTLQDVGLYRCSHPQRHFAYAAVTFFRTVDYHTEAPPFTIAPAYTAAVCAAIPRWRRNIAITCARPYRRAELRAVSDVACLTMKANQLPTHPWSGIKRVRTMGPKSSRRVWPWLKASAILARPRSIGIEDTDLQAYLQKHDLGPKPRRIRKCRRLLSR